MIKFVVDNNRINVIAGINEETSHYSLQPNKTFITPEFAMTYSTSGKGGVSRTFHKWAKKYKLNQDYVERDILLNSWEGLYIKVYQKVIYQMMKDISSIGSELFILDYGWFDDKYPINGGSTSLGD